MERARTDEYLRAINFLPGTTHSMRPFATMRATQILGIFFLAALITFSDQALAQDLHPSRRPSPIGIARTHIGDAYVKVTYGRPYRRGRAIFGANTDDQQFLVPFGQVWRTGANEATEITFTEDLLIDGNRVEAGTYAIFTEPGAETWTIHFSPHLGLDGTGRFDAETETFTQVFDPEEDVLTIRLPTGSTDEEVDQFTISFDHSSPKVADLVLSWERTEVRIPFEAAP